tara:strand:- start:1 stop:189 length:189 start_codon:yes stop_codon:yes gene_type:complete
VGGHLKEGRIAADEHVGLRHQINVVLGRAASAASIVPEVQDSICDARMHKLSSRRSDAVNGV